MKFISNGRYIAPVILLTAAILFGALGIAFIFTSKKKIKNCTEKTVATIYDIKENKNLYGGTTYRLLFRYDFRGEEYTGKSSLSLPTSTFKVFDVDEEIIIEVNPEKPEEYNYLGYGSIILGYIFIGFGILMFTSTIISLIISKITKLPFRINFFIK